MTYRSVEWHTDSNGQVTEIAVEYDQTFWQWVFRKPATQKRWRIRSGKEWWIVLDENTMSSIENAKDVKELLKAMEYVWHQNYLKDLEDRCRKMLQDE